MASDVWRAQTKKVLTEFYSVSPRLVSTMEGLAAQLTNYSTTAYLGLSQWALNTIVYFQKEFMRTDNAQDVLGRQGLLLANSITEAFFFETLGTQFRRNPRLLTDAFDRALQIAQEAEQKLKGTGQLLQLHLIEIPRQSDTKGQIMHADARNPTLNLQDVARGWGHAAQASKLDVVRLNANIRTWLDKGGDEFGLPTDLFHLDNPFIFRLPKKKGTYEVLKYLADCRTHASINKIAEGTNMDRRKVNSGCDELKEWGYLHVNEMNYCALWPWVVVAYKEYLGKS